MVVAEALQFSYGIYQLLHGGLDAGEFRIHHLAKLAGAPQRVSIRLPFDGSSTWRAKHDMATVIDACEVLAELSHERQHVRRHDCWIGSNVDTDAL